MYDDWLSGPVYEYGVVTDYFANPLFCGANIYVNGTPLTDLNINNTNTIQQYQFYNCKSLKTLIIDGSDTEIDNNAFFGCSNLQDVKLKGTVRKIGEKAFWNCAKLNDIYFYNPECIIYEAYETLPGAAVIHGYEDSTAQIYAGNYNRKFVLIEDEPAIIGDTNDDGVVDVLDAAMIQKHAVGKASFTNEQLYFADVNNDNSVDILDAAEIQKYAVGKITEFKKKA